MVTQRDYSAELVKAAHSVLLELFHLFGEYREHIVLVGGWVPEFLFSKHDTHHVGSIDVDLALNHPEGMNRIAEEFRPHLENGLVKEGLQKIAKHFE